MTLDEAIAHEKELAEENYMQGMLCHANPNDEKLDEYVENGRHHEQIAEWLEEYKRLKELFAKTFIKDCNTCEQEIYEKCRKDERGKILNELETAIDRCDDTNDMLMLMDLMNKLKAGVTND